MGPGADMFLEKGEEMSDYLFISDAAKEVKVESHVLRYWEDELRLPIKRNELGHRYYTEEDVERFKQIKGMKERGLQLKAIKMILKDGRLDVLPTEHTVENPVREEDLMDRPQEGEGGLAIDIVSEREAEPARRVTAAEKEEKSRRLQWLLQQLIRQTLRENNMELCREIRESVLKELDYQFRVQEEREEARDRMLAERDEEHYKRMDELLRKKNPVSRRLIKEKKAKETCQESSLEALGEAPPEKKKRRFFKEAPFLWISPVRLHPQGTVLRRNRSQCTFQGRFQIFHLLR